MDSQTLASLPPHVLAAYLRDPKLAMAADMAKEGSDTSPVASPWQGLARVLKGGLAGYEQDKLNKNYQSQGEGYNKSMANVIRALGSGGLDAGIQAAGQDPMVASEIGKDLALQKAKSDYEVNKLMAVEGMKRSLDPEKAFKDKIYNSMLGTPASGQQLPPQPSMGGNLNLPPLPSGALNQAMPMGGKPPMPPSADNFNGMAASSNQPAPNQAMGATVQPDAAFNAQPQQPLAQIISPSASNNNPAQNPVNDVQSAALEQTLGKPRDGMMWTMQNGQPMQVQSNAARKLSPTEQKELFDKMDLVNAGSGAISSLADAQKTLAKGNSFAGFGAETAAQLNRVPIIGGLIDDQGAEDTTRIKNAVTEQALNQLKAIFGGNPTEGERNVLLQLQALPSFTKEEQAMILQRAQDSAQQRIQFNKSMVEGIQTGNYRTAPPAQVMPQQPQQSGGMITVTNGQETLQIPEADLQEAQRDGFMVKQ